MPCIFLPWQFYINSTFPVEAGYEQEYNTIHFFEAVEGHTGEWYYHFEKIVKSLGWIVALLALSYLLLNIKDRFRNKEAIIFTVYSLSMMIFFSLAATKMPLFCLSTYPVLLLVSVIMLSKLDLNSRLQGTIFIVLSLGVVFAVAKPQYLSNRHDPVRMESGLKDYKTKMLRAKNQALMLKPELGERSVIFGCNEKEYINYMFYTDATAYPRTEHYAKIDSLYEAGYDIRYVTGSEVDDEILKRPWIKVYITEPNLYEEKRSFSYLKTSNKGYIVAGEDGILQCSSDSATKFQVLSNSNFSWILSPENKFLCFDDNRGDPLVANRDKHGLWEQFTIGKSKGQAYLINYKNDTVQVCNSRIVYLDHTID